MEATGGAKADDAQFSDDDDDDDKNNELSSSAGGGRQRPASALSSSSFSERCHRHRLAVGVAALIVATAGVAVGVVVRLSLRGGGNGGSTADGSDVDAAAYPTNLPTELPMRNDSPSANPTSASPVASSVATTATPTPPPVELRRSSIVLAVLPDTQMYSDGAPYIFESQTRWLAGETAREVLGGGGGANGDADAAAGADDDASPPFVPFVLHLGDLVHSPDSRNQWSVADVAMRSLEHSGVGFSVSTGNHDLVGSTTWDTQRDSSVEMYLEYFPSSRAKRLHPTAFGGGRDPSGFSEYHLVDVAGAAAGAGIMRLLVLAVDWRANASTLAWARGVLDDHPSLPAVLMSHEFLGKAEGSDDSIADDAVRTAYGNYIWDNLIRTNSQIFMVVCGHNFGSAYRIDVNDFDESVFQMLVNYQNTHAGGNGYFRLLELDFYRGTVEALTFSPFVADLFRGGGREALGPNDRVELIKPAHKYVIPFDLAGRFESIGAVVPPEMIEGGPGTSRLDPVRSLIASVPSPEVKVKPEPRDEDDYPAVDETLAHWRFHGRPAGRPVDPESDVVMDVTGNGNDLIREEGWLFSQPDHLSWSDSHHPRSSSNGSVCFTSPAREGGAFLTTVPTAPLALETFPDGFTVEAFVRLRNGANQTHKWSGAVARRGEGQDASKTDNDPKEPLAALDFSTSGEAHWGHFPENLPGSVQAWSAPLEEGRWYHVAAVNGGGGTTSTGETRLYVDGYRARRDAIFDLARGVATGKGTGWTVGSSSYDGRRKVFGGCIGEVRVSGRALRPEELLLARRRPAD